MDAPPGSTRKEALEAMKRWNSGPNYAVSEATLKDTKGKLVDLIFDMQRLLDRYHTLERRQRAIIADLECRNLDKDARGIQAQLREGDFISNEITLVHSDMLLYLTKTFKEGE